ncbi:MAG: MarR family transcriptional regulator [Bacillaceae bacterium]|nr:MarR family transcriptional regulator [Bacillaceae bacterium]
MNLLLKQQLLLTVRALYFCMDNQWSEIGKEYDISPAQQHILFLLSTNRNELTPSKIGELGCWHASTVTRLLKRLENNGYIDVRAKENQARYKLVSMTDKGKCVLKNIFETVKSMEQFPFDLRQLSEDEVVHFINYGKKILDVHKGESFMRDVISKPMKDLDYA